MYNQPVKMDKKKIIELSLLLVGILWFILLGINYVRYTKSKGLIFAIKSHSDYADGYVDEWVSLGYTYRVYNRVAISKEEFVPFWVLRQNPAAKNDLPKPETGYKVPDNPRREENHMGILYFYSNEDNDLIGTYKCINTNLDCMIARTGWDKYDIVNTDPITARDPYKFSNIYDKYIFIDDSSKQEFKYGDNGYVRTIYLLKIDKKQPEILARYADIKETSYDEMKEMANYKNNTYIVKSYENNKWGMIRITESGDIKEVLPFEYESITYDYDTKYYIMCKDNIWYVYDLINSKAVSVEAVDVIYDVWKNSNNSYYFKTGRERTVGEETFRDYSVYRFDGTEFLKKDRVTEIIPRKTYLMYITANDNKLHFMTYSGQEKWTVQLAFSRMDHDRLAHPAFEIYTENDFSMALKVYKGRDLKYDYEIVTVMTQKWDLNEEE